MKFFSLFCLFFSFFAFSAPQPDLKQTLYQLTGARHLDGCSGFGGGGPDGEKYKRLRAIVIDPKSKVKFAYDGPYGIYYKLSHSYTDPKFGRYKVKATFYFENIENNDSIADFDMEEIYWVDGEKQKVGTSCDLIHE